MQDFPMRERIYLPVVRFGVPHTDWKYVFLITFAGFVVPFVFGLTFYGIPAPMFTGIITLAATVAFFNFIRMGRRPYWFQHTLRSFLTSSTHRATLPKDELNESWLKESNDAFNQQHTSATSAYHTPSLVFRFES
ncbi:MAG: hypothetical protein MSG64_21095 [Pyrinomonadaceae bacterium MAG19_C2-C3]|nr:hypothetical protein [Pyrinomonadaceae bacterium MAG19_C2-C3]